VRLLRCAPVELLERQGEESARERAEGIRVAYVAATRARDLLVVPAVGDEELDGWTAPLHKALYPRREEWRRFSTAPGCPKFGEASVLSRADRLAGEKEFSVRPGLHAAREGSHSVVWWDPATLRLQVESDYGLRQEELLREDDAGVAAASLARHGEWQQHRDATLTAGERPSVDVVIPAETGVPPPDFAVEVAVETAARPEARPGGRRFGTLVHALLRDTPLDAGARDLAALATALGRALGATPDGSSPGGRARFGRYLSGRMGVTGLRQQRASVYSVTSLAG
jgi:ATP-dependent exoDNAse (exonuclease V) beta subunit